jgi:DNA-binding transcriptional regulator YdaS (Cro superfamily)
MPAMNLSIKRAIEALGSGAALASAIPQYISQLLNGGRPIPAELCPAIERATGGKVRCEDLRPDVAWDVLRMQAAPKPEALKVD